MTLRVFTAAAFSAACACGEPVRGSFVQRRLLKDVGVVLASSGEWSFEKGREFVWNTLKPVPSRFAATPTNYTFTAGGRTSVRRLEMRIDDFARLFEMKEMKDFVDRVETGGASPAYSDGEVTIPSSLRVFFKNGDRLDIAISRAVDSGHGR